MTSNRILVPLDGSKIAEHSLAYVRKLADLGQAEVLLLSVVDADRTAGLVNAEEVATRETNVLQSYLGEIAEDFRRRCGLKVWTRITTGRPADSILTVASDFKPDILLISTHGRSGLTRWRFGSVADKVIRGGVTNTFVIGPQATDRERWIEADVEPAFKSIMVPLDGSLLAEEALPVAQRFAQIYDATVHLVRAVPIPNEGSEVYFTGDLLEEFEEAGRIYVEDVAARLAPLIEVRSKVVIGPASAVLEDYIKSEDIHLVVMTSHGRGGVIRTAMGSVTDRMLGSSAPVLVVRS